MIKSEETRKRKPSSPVKNGEDDNSEMVYEKKPRLSGKPKSKKFKERHLLPIKIASGKLVSQVIKDDQMQDSDGGSDQEEMMMTLHRTSAPAANKRVETSFNGLLKNRRKALDEKKTRIAALAAAILTDPQSSVKMLKELGAMVEDRDSPETCATVRKLAVASMSCLFVDLIPGYRIRERTEQEKQVRLSKEVKRLTDYEDGLLKHYQLYLKALEKMIRCRTQPAKSRLISADAQKSLGEVAVKSLIELYLHTAHFNFHKNITVVLVNVAHADKDPALRALCCDAMKTLFATDKHGAATLETVKCAAKIAKESASSRVKPELLDTLLSLRIKRVDYSLMPHPKNKHERKRAKDEKRKLSRRELKRQKKRQALDNELKEAAASEDMEERTKLHTETIQQVFWIYFRILKRKKGDAKHLLPCVLEGLATYAHLINVDFFHDLLQVLQQLTASSTLSLRENLHCISAAFQILSGQGEALNIDPAQFYNHAHTLLFDLAAGTKQSGCDDDVKILIKCLDMMLSQRRKQITLACLCAFVKRLAATALQLSSAKSAVVLLAEARKLLSVNSKTSSLFDAESQDIGMYDPEEDDPNHSGSLSTCLWDVHTLRRHYVPNVRQAANVLISEHKQ